MKRDASQGSRDHGAALLLAIVVVTGVAVAIAAALGFAATSVTSSANSYQPARTALYKADAAIKLAAAYYTANADGGLIADCADGTTTLTIDASTTVEVCDSRDGGDSFEGDAPGPPYGLMTTSLTDGVDLQTGRIRIAGGVYSASTVTGPDGNTGTNLLTIERGDLRAVGECDGNIEVADGYLEECEGDPVVVPVYSTGMEEVPVVGSAADCALRAGYWDDESFEDATDGCDVIHLLPGLHYLHDVDWQLSAIAVGGTLTNGLTLATLDPDTDLPGACDLTAPGTMIVLGGTSTIDLNGQGAIEVCGLETTQGSDEIRIPLIGSDTALTGDAGGDDVTLTVSPSGAVATSVPKKTAGVNGTASVTRTFDTLESLASATVLTLSWTGSSISPLSATVDVSNDDSAASPCVNDAPIGAGAGLIDASACLTGLDLPLTATFTFTNGTAAAKTATITGLSLVASGAGSGSGSGDVSLLDGDESAPVLSTTATNKLVVLHGVTYLPTRPIDLNVPNDASVGASRALIVESITINAGGGSAGDERLPIVGADLLQPGDGELTFTAFVDGEAWISTRGTYTAGDGPLSLAIDRWVVRR
ncbi:MAG: hypothetical protein RLZ04_1768 [Actinomycetota bacterium]